MGGPERSLYFESPRRPYSWTGELETPFSSIPLENGSLKMPKSVHGAPRDVRELYIRPDKRERNALRDLDKVTPAKRSQFNFPRSGSQLLTEKVPSYLSESSAPLTKSEQFPLSSASKIKSSENRIVSTPEKKKSKFSNLRRKSPPNMTSHVSEFEYFSLSDPPPGLARPVQIFPPDTKHAKREKEEQRVKVTKDKEGKLTKI